MPLRYSEKNSVSLDTDIFAIDTFATDILDYNFFCSDILGNTLMGKPGFRKKEQTDGQAWRVWTVYRFFRKIYEGVNTLKKE